MIVTHDPEFIMECCDYVIEFSKGKVKNSYPLNAAGLENLFDFFGVE